MRNLLNKTPRGKRFANKSVKCIRSWGEETELAIGMQCLFVYSFDEKTGKPKTYEVRQVSSSDFEDVEG